MNKPAKKTALTYEALNQAAAALVLSTPILIVLRLAVEFFVLR